MQPGLRAPESSLNSRELLSEKALSAPEALLRWGGVGWGWGWGYVGGRGMCGDLVKASAFPTSKRLCYVRRHVGDCP